MNKLTLCPASFVVDPPRKIEMISFIFMKAAPTIIRLESAKVGGWSGMRGLSVSTLS